MPVTTARVDTTAADFGLGGRPGRAGRGRRGRRRGAAGGRARGLLRRPARPGPLALGQLERHDLRPGPGRRALAVQSAGGSAWLRSSQTFSQQTLEGRVSFGAGPWQHVGFADDGFVEPLGDPVDRRGRHDPLRPHLPSRRGREPHRPAGGRPRRLPRRADRLGRRPRVDYYVDGALVASPPGRAAGADATSTPRTTGRRRWGSTTCASASYAPGAAAYVSSVKDAGAPVTWGQLSWDAAVPAGTGLALETRSSADGADLVGLDGGRGQRRPDREPGRALPAVPGDPDLLGDRLAAPRPGRLHDQRRPDRLGPVGQRDQRPAVRQARAEPRGREHGRQQPAAALRSGAAGRSGRARRDHGRGPLPAARPDRLAARAQAAGLPLPGLRSAERRRSRVAPPAWRAGLEGALRADGAGRLAVPGASPGRRHLSGRRRSLRQLGAERGRELHGRAAGGWRPRLRRPEPDRSPLLRLLGWPAVPRAGATTRASTSVDSPSTPRRSWRATPPTAPTSCASG